MFNEAIVFYEEAIQICPKKRQELAIYNSNIAACYMKLVMIVSFIFFLLIYWLKTTNKKKKEKRKNE